MKRATVLLVLIVFPLLAALAQAQSGDGYDSSWWTVDGGGGTVSDSSSGYTLMGTAGQPDAATLAGGSYTLVGGFWSAWGGGAEAPEEYEIYLPVILRDF